MKIMIEDWVVNAKRLRNYKLYIFFQYSITKTGCEDYGGSDACKRKGEFFTCINSKKVAREYTCECLPDYKMNNEDECVAYTTTSTENIASEKSTAETTTVTSSPATENITFEQSSTQTTKIAYSPSTENTTLEESSTPTPKFTSSPATEIITFEQSSTLTTKITYSSSTENTILEESSTPTPKITSSPSTENITLERSSTQTTKITSSPSLEQSSTQTTKTLICTSNPCKYGGTCLQKADDYECLCLYGYRGKNCEDCTLKCGNAECVFNQNIKEGACKCAINQRFDFEGRTCKELDECEQKFLNGDCRGAYETCDKGKCKCEENFQYNKNKICKPDLCKNKSCKENEFCKETVNGDAVCVCEDGFHLTSNGCQADDKCILMKPKCSQKCFQGNCTCEEGFELNPKTRKCKNPYGTVLCSNTHKCSPGKCHVLNGMEICLCPEATHVSINDTCKDKCSANLIPKNMCPTGKCKSLGNNGFKCICDEKYKQAADNIYCERKNMCSEGGGKKECSKRNAHCNEDPNNALGYSCSCEKGFGFEANTCIPLCEIKDNIIECLKKSGVCELDENYKFTCKCPPLFEMDNYGNCVEKVKYSFIGNIVIPKTIYGNNLNTVKKVGNHHIPTFDYSKIKRDFVKSLKGVYGENYKNLSIISCSDKSQDFSCSVELKFYQDPQKTKTLNIITTPSVCIPLKKKQQYCMVPPSFVMKQTNQAIFRKTHPCDDTVKSKLCGSTTTCRKTDGLNLKTDGEFFNCSCISGFYSKMSKRPFKNENSFIDICEDIDECKMKDSCPKNTTCFNTQGSYECFCEVGYRNTTYDIKKKGCIAVCDNNPCGQHGTCMLSGKHGYMCKCDLSYTGAHCETPNKTIKDIEDTNHIIILSVSIILGSLILISLIGIFIIYKRFEKRYYKETKNKHPIFKSLRFLSKRVRLMWNPKYDANVYHVTDQVIAETLEQAANSIELQIKKENECSDETPINVETSQMTETELNNSKNTEKVLSPEEDFNLKL